MKVALVYSFKTVKTKQVALQITKAFADSDIVELDAEIIDILQLIGYDLVVIGVPTWFDGELPEYWDIRIPEIEQIDFSGKKIALFGLGNQKEYPENFVDAIGILADVFKTQGAEIIGFTDTAGYSFESSKAIWDGRFCGLAIDTENQAALTKERVKHWVSGLKGTF